MIPIAARDAIAARADDGSVDKERFRQSGGTALISAILKQVDAGRRSALDLAEVLLLQNEDALKNLDEVLAVGEEQEDYGDFAEPEEAPEVAATPEPMENDAGEDPEDDVFSVGDDDAETPAPVAFAKHPAPTMSPLRKREVTAEPRLSGQDAARVNVGIARLRDIAARRAEEGLQAPPATEVMPATREAYAHAVATLEENAASLAEQLEELGDKAPSAVINQALQDLNWLCDYLASHGDDADPALERARETAFDAADLVQLMQMEKRDSAAIEALSLLLQVKRELQADLAA